MYFLARQIDGLIAGTELADSVEGVDSKVSRTDAEGDHCVGGKKFNYKNTELRGTLKTKSPKSNGKIISMRDLQELNKEDPNGYNFLKVK